jgi:glycine/D-amino acid oxidase-like deaminating enzyme
VDVAVVGGGIVGTAIAAFLAEAGLTVRLFERVEIASGASGRNSGIVQHPWDPVLADLYRRSLAVYRELGAERDGALGFPAEPAGLLYVGRDPELAKREAASWAATWPATRAEVVDGSALRALEPALAPDLSACRLAIGYPVEPGAATRAFAASAATSGVELVLGADVSIAVEGDRAVGVLRDGRFEPAGRVVIAAGPWTPGVVDPTGAWRPIRPVWGVVASIRLSDAPRHGLEAIDIDIEPGDEPRKSDGASDDDQDGRSPADAGVDFSLVPAAGSSALGSTFLADEPVPAEWVERLRRVGARYVPGVADAPLLGLRHCARPVSLDGRPLVGEASWCRDLWIAAGHGPWGISTGPGTARLVADRILERSDEPIPAALDAGRFGPPKPGARPGTRMLAG